MVRPIAGSRIEWRERFPGRMGVWRPGVLFRWDDDVALVNPSDRPSTYYVQVAPRDVRRLRERTTEKKKRVANPFKEPPAERNEPYLDFVRKHPCMNCHADGPSDPHHFGPRGIATKTSDLRTVPLCRRCHDEFHNSGGWSIDVSRDETEKRIYRRQVELLIEWMRKDV